MTLAVAYLMIGLIVGAWIFILKVESEPSNELFLVISAIVALWPGIIAGFAFFGFLKLWRRFCRWSRTKLKERRNDGQKTL